MQDSGNYAQKPIPLTGGLDLVSPRMLVEPGRLVDVLNYECVDTDGYKRIDGFERYDGGPTPSAVSGYYFYTNASNSDQAAFETNSGLHVGSLAGLYYDINGTGVDVNVVPVTVTGVTFFDPDPGEQAYWKVTFDTDQPVDVDNIISTWDGIDTLVVYDSPTAPTLFVSILPPLVDGVTVDGSGISNGGLLSLAIASADTQRATVDALPQDQFVYALQHYKDRLHVVADCRYLYLAYDTTTSPAVGLREFFVGNTFRIGGSGGMEGVILDWRFLRGAFDGLGSTAGNRAWIKVLVYPTVPNGTTTTDTTFNVDRVNSPFSSATVSCWKHYTSIDVSGPTDDEPVWGGVLYKGLVEGTERTDDNAWTQIDMGYEVTFENGSSTIEPRELTLATTSDQLNEEPESVVASPANDTSSFTNIAAAYEDDAVGVTTPPGWPSGGTDDQLVLTDSGYDLTVDDGTGVWAQQVTGRWGDGSGIRFTNFDLNLPEDVIITGIQVDASCWCYEASPITANPTFYTVKLHGLPTASDNKGGPTFAVTSNSAAAPNTFTFGGPADIWGLGTVTAADLNDSSFELEMTPSVTSASTVSYLLWDVLTVKVYYFRPTGKFFFRSAALSDSVEAKLVRVHLDSGSWANGDAKGVAHVYSPIATANRNNIQVGDTIRLTASGSDIATVTSVRGSFLPSHTELVASDRRFQIIRANYYLNPEWESVYGVHGLGRAWSYDNSYFRKIYTEYDSSLDKPTHLCSYRNYLALGFTSGNMLLSAISGDSGPLPEEFRATKGAREFVFVDHIHGLHELADTSLGVFCKSSINRLVFNTGASSPDGLFYQAVISPNSGCIEYTVAGFGDSTLYCDQYGIRTVEQTDVYGDLIAKPLSYSVSPWLRPRLSNKKYWIDSKASKRPLFAHTVKAKNQYRVWFDDGAVLCMNLNSADSAPQFTFLKYGFDFGGQFLPLCPIAFTNDTDNSITERIHLAHWNRKLPSTNVENSAAKFKYVYELERGWSFDGQDFPARLTVNLSLLDSPYNFDNVRKAELHGLDYNNTTLFCGWGTKYSEELSYSGLAMGDTFTPAGRNVAGAVGTDYTPFSKMIQAASRGRPLLMKLKNSSTATGGEEASAIEPPHILQAVLLQYIPLRNEG